jgi:putative flippase GtrA
MAVGQPEWIPRLTRVGRHRAPIPSRRASERPAGGRGDLTVRAEFVRFVAVGFVGFVVDAGVLTLLASFLGWNVYAARGVSFGIAVFVTWLINRRWTFGSRTMSGAAAAGAEYSRYLVVQVIGALANLGVFVGVLAIQPGLIRYPVVPLAFGAVAGLLVNYCGARAWVFAHRFAR